MDEQHGRYAEDDADDLLRRALIDPEASVAVALKVNGLRPGRVYELRIDSLRSETGEPVLHPEAYYTLNDRL